jgi:dTDP-4-dehydrorhamnose reductase
MDIQNQQLSTPEIWGGIECTINRVGDHFSDQLVMSGCYDSDHYLHAVASLEIKAIRFPVLWERHQPVKNEAIDWTWCDRQLHKLRDRNIEPIAGLVHHGSGPEYTNLLDPRFPELLSEYARQVAVKFPWIKYYTPINEPLTTARFSGLYGLWYPHKQDNKSFLTMLLNQLKAVVLSMRAIRKINPHAKLVQTEDLAKIHSTVLLRYQRDFENHRRWLSYDLLCGKVTPGHPLFRFCIKQGIPTEDLKFFADNPCPPDIIGVNYYITSERYLDENIESYPACSHGGNGKHRYADVEAVRVIKPAGIKKLLQEAYKRYRIPLAVTEVHLGCTRDEQLRWFAEIWNETIRAKEDGVDVRAVTAWSILGAYDWNSLLTRKENHHEPGVFDNQNRGMRRTAIAKLVASLANGRSYHHPVLMEKGWWHREERFIGIKTTGAAMQKKADAPPLLIAGKTGTLGQAFSKICSVRNIPFKLLSRQEMDILDPASIEHALNRYKPWAFINATGYVRVDDAETDVENCFRVNAIAPKLMAASCKLHSIPFMMFSSDLVFDGNKQNPYTESDSACPINVYGRSKAHAEQLTANTDPESLIIRTSSFFGPWDRHNFAHHVLESLQRNQVFHACDMMISPTYVPDLVNAALDLLIDEEKGIWHLCNDGHISWVDFAIELALRAGHSKNNILRKCPEEMNWKAKRPAYTVMESSRGIRLPKLESAIDIFFAQQQLWNNLDKVPG